MKDACATLDDRLGIEEQKSAVATDTAAHDPRAAIYSVTHPLVRAAMLS